MSGFFIAWRKVKMAQESCLVIVIDSQNAERNVKALAEELSKFTDRGDSASKSSKDMGKQLSVTNNIVQNFNTTVNNSNTSVQKLVAVTNKQLNKIINLLKKLKLQPMSWINRIKRLTHSVRQLKLWLDIWQAWLRSMLQLVK